MVGEEKPAGCSGMQCLSGDVAASFGGAGRGRSPRLQMAHRRRLGPTHGDVPICAPSRKNQSSCRSETRALTAPYLGVEVAGGDSEVCRRHGHLSTSAEGRVIQRLSNGARGAQASHMICTALRGPPPGELTGVVSSPGGGLAVATISSTGTSDTSRQVGNMHMQRRQASYAQKMLDVELPKGVSATLQNPWWWASSILPTAGNSRD